MIVADDQSKPPPGKCGASLQVFVHTTDFGQHTEIALHGTLNRDYKLRLFVENEELELRTQDDQTWTPAQHAYVPYFFTTNTW